MRTSKTRIEYEMYKVWFKIIVHSLWSLDVAKTIQDPDSTLVNETCLVRREAFKTLGLDFRGALLSSLCWTSCGLDRRIFDHLELSSLVFETWNLPLTSCTILRNDFFACTVPIGENIVFQVSKTTTHFMFSVCLSQHFSFSSSKQFQAVSSFAHAVQLHPFNTRWCLGTWGILTDTNWMKEEWLLQNVNGGLPKLSVMCREIPWNTQHPIGRWSKKMYQLPRFAYSQSCKKWRCALNLT